MTNDKLDDILETVRFIKDNAVTKQEFSEKIEKLDNRLTKVESQMVTKEYLDKKLGNLKGDLVVLTRKEDNKLNKLVEILGNKKVLIKSETSKITSLEPFPQLSI
ncbi:MAG: hypothetical protein Q7K39_04205 [Candidatus Magasanikbacteria bacterium]|nr:hypothetical protein [Candidatus Magasanikbacteria bacterium]